MEDLYKNTREFMTQLISNNHNIVMRSITVKSRKDLKQMKILDLCGGTGSHADVFTGYVNRLTIVDRSEDVLKVTRNKNRLIRTVHLNIFEYSFDMDYNIILCMYGAIHYNKDLQKIQQLIRKTKQYLKPGGKVLSDFRYSDYLRENNCL